MKTQRLVISDLWYENVDILGVELRNDDGSALPSFTAGAHLVVFLRPDLVRHYSLLNAPDDDHRYQIGILRAPSGRGGSTWAHDNLRRGMPLTVSLPRNNFQLDETVSNSLLIAGGIGITPILCMAKRLATLGARFQLYYCTRSRDVAGFLGQVESLRGQGGIHLVYDGGDPTRGLDVAGLVAAQDEDTVIYCCGPRGLMNAVRIAGASRPASRLRFESFANDTPADQNVNKPFQVIIESTGARLHVPADRTLLEVLNENGFAIDSLCREGVCGTCIVEVISGKIDHRDCVLHDSEKKSNSAMTTCCSRAISEPLVLAL